MYIGIDIGGTKILAVSSADGTKLDGSEKAETPSDPATAIKTIIELTESLAKKSQITSIGIVAPGPFNPARTAIHAYNLGWHNEPLSPPIHDYFKVPVTLEHDTNGAALTEATYGAGNGYNPVLYVTISTGIGTGLVIDGKIYRGANDTEGGHIIIDPKGPLCTCGVSGHFEAIVSGPAIKRRYGKPAYAITDPKIWDEIANNMAQGLSNLSNTLSPAIIVLGGGVSTHYDRFIEPLTKYMKKYSTIYESPPIVLAKHAEEAAAYGALILAHRLASRQ